MGTNKHQYVMAKLLDEVEKKYGEEKIQEYIKRFRPLAFEGMDREIVCQVISCQAWYRRVFFFMLYPRYVAPYLIRIREKKTA